MSDEIARLRARVHHLEGVLHDAMVCLQDCVESSDNEMAHAARCVLALIDDPIKSARTQADVVEQLLEWQEAASRFFAIIQKRLPREVNEHGKRFGLLYFNPTDWDAVIELQQATLQQTSTRETLRRLAEWAGENASRIVQIWNISTPPAWRVGLTDTSNPIGYWEGRGPDLLAAVGKALALTRVAFREIPIGGANG